MICLNLPGTLLSLNAELVVGYLGESSGELHLLKRENEGETDFKNIYF